ncbi:erythromycin esterase family protein [Actinoplanes sp. Pm04-4]|uniref:Erythromycin esterase family protein n=1 Tax=Paractinoplanes pyxinae TaxID=2997416 RepID=A0ABT4BD36_9ACTN|nr:erythromycin esterase family protein [Actinoplanes pyxinae]MCY1144424.1 erythromycin esterase family protein [Actinoplanes pyxinae]
MHRYGDEVAAIARPLVDEGDLDVLLDRVGDARVVMIGEASHGTHEYYVWRSALTRRLIAERGFSFVAVEGDWPDCQRVDASVRGGDATPLEALLGYERWPTWMWANEEVVDFADWLRSFNASSERKIGFHGLDVYSMWESLREILTWLREHDPSRVDAALSAYHCLSAYSEDPQSYAWATKFLRASCEDDVVRMLIDLRGRDLAAPNDSAPNDSAPTGSATRPNDFAARWNDFAVRQNAEVVAGAEHYYRAMVRGGPDSWNVRDRHMDATLARLLDHYGDGSRAVVWAHNTHVGDANATDQAVQGEVTIGSLARERFGADQVVLVGLGGHRGSVIAGRTWGGPMTELAVPPGRPGSLEDILHATAPPRALFVFPPLGERPDLLVDALPHRAIGVVYRPEHEQYGNYVPSVIGDRYDAFLWFDETRALRPLHPLHVDTHELETYPTGV